MKKDINIMLLATLMIAALVFVTWSTISFSTWIVGHSGVEDLLRRDKEYTLIFLKDEFWSSGRWLLLAEVITGMIFLGLLWRRLAAARKN